MIDYNLMGNETEDFQMEKSIDETKLAKKSKPHIVFGAILFSVFTIRVLLVLRYNLHGSFPKTQACSCRKS